MFKEDIFHNVAEPEVAELCKKAGGRLLVWHAAIGTALAESVDNNFSATVMALVSQHTCRRVVCYVLLVGRQPTWQNVG